MKLPRDVAGEDLVKRLGRLGYRVTRQTGSHVRITCEQPKTHHLTIPKHPSLRVGTLAAIVAEVARHQGITRDELLMRLFG